MGAPTKRAKKVRVEREFDLVNLAAELRPPKLYSGNYAWTLDAIRDARDQQMLGRFARPARLAEATRTDYAIFASFLNRLAPQRGLPVKIQAPNDTARALRIADEAGALYGPQGVGIHPDTLADIDGTLANHGVAFGVNVVTPRDDGSRVDIELRSWPIEFVDWDPQERCYRTQTIDGPLEYIRHGDGRWTVFQEHECEPWKYGALLAVAMLWADHAYGVRDRAKAGTAHGNAKVVGAMPEGVPLQDSSGHLTTEAQAFLDLLRAVASVDTPIGIKPFGATLDYITNNSRAWEIFKEIISSGERAADRVYLGHDVTATAAGGDAVGYLFGVRNDIVEGSLRAIERGIRTGVIEPWCAINFGDSTLAPDRIYLMPDADEDARRKSLAEQTNAFYDAIKSAKANGFDVNETYVHALAADFGVIQPKLPAESNKAPSITLAPTDIAIVVKVNEARASAGLGPLTLPDGSLDPDGGISVAAFKAKQEAKASSPTPSGVVTPPSQTPPTGSAPLASAPLRAVQ
jgi:hypothetical protein